MRRAVGLSGLFVLLLAGGALAQTVSQTTGAIDGKVTDPSEAVLPGVTVTIASEAMMGTRDTVTNETGTFRFVSITPGLYAVSFELPGFATVKRTDVRVGALSSVDDRFAWDEGEDDRTRAKWLEEHERYFRRYLPTIGVEFTDDMATVFERFELLYSE